MLFRVADFNRLVFVHLDESSMIFNMLCSWRPSTSTCTRLSPLNCWFAKSLRAQKKDVTIVHALRTLLFNRSEQSIFTLVHALMSVPFESSASKAPADRFLLQLPSLVGPFCLLDAVRHFPAALCIHLVGCVELPHLIFESLCPPSRPIVCPGTFSFHRPLPLTSGSFLPACLQVVAIF